MALRRDLPQPGKSTAPETKKVFCANCSHCAVVPEPYGDGTRYRLRVRCTAGKWRKRLGEEKTYKYFTVILRAAWACEAYDSMGESEEFLKELKRDLPTTDEVYIN